MYRDVKKVGLACQKFPSNFVPTDMAYVNLEKYPESNTGYLDGSIVWSRIYNENCFKGPVDAMCLEERVFYRLISGLHTSITIHIANYFEKDGNNWLPNLDMYARSVAAFPDRINNLNFAYLFLLRYDV